jgi:Putative metallopeptidase
VREIGFSGKCSTVRRALVVGWIVFFLIDSELLTKKAGGGVEVAGSSISSGARNHGGVERRHGFNSIAAANGKLKFRYSRPINVSQSSVLRDITTTEKANESAVSTLNEQISLPFDIYISFRNCGGPDAFYTEEDREITICHEIIAGYYVLLSETVKNETELQEAVGDAIMSLTLHEVAHALIDTLALPITGREEDAADQFSTLILIKRFPRGERKVLNAARMYKILSNFEIHNKADYWDEHSFDAQRYYDTICLVYGHNPKEYAYLVERNILPEERSEICEQDFQRIERSWEQLLSQYSKSPLWMQNGKGQSVSYDLTVNGF